MFRRSFRRAALGAVLVAVLSAASPVHAAGWSIHGSQSLLTQAWAWLQDLWPTPTTLSCTDNCDRGHGVDPDG